MKLVIAALLAGTAAAAVAFNNDRLANVVDDTDGSVKVSAYCTGLDPHSLSAKALAYSAKALELTYNAVYEKKSGQEPLTLVTANSPFMAYGVAPNKKNGLLRGMSTWVGGSGCRNCPKDDDQTMTEAALSFTVVGGSGCRNCPKDDDGASIMVHQADWEVEFAAVLSKAPHAALAGVQKCTIMYNDDDKTLGMKTKVGGSGCRNCPKDDDVMRTVPVILNVKCDQINFAEISLQALLTSAKTLEETYNAIHQSLDGDDTPALESVEVEYGPGFSSAGGPGAMTILGGSGCRNCPKDDSLLAEEEEEEDQQNHDLVFTAINKGVDEAFVTDKALKAWENLFVASLHKESKHSGGDFFQQIGQCTITMSSAIVAATLE